MCRIFEKEKVFIIGAKKFLKKKKNLGKSYYELIRITCHDNPVKSHRKSVKNPIQFKEKYQREAPKSPV